METIQAPVVSFGQHYQQQRPCCRDFMRGKCSRGDACRFEHLNTSPSSQRRPPMTKKRNTETFEPMKKPVDMRVVVDSSKSGTCSVKIDTRDVVLVPHLFDDFETGVLYEKLLHEIEHCGVPQETLLKLWHGDTHYIADDHTNWKKNAATFSMVLNRIANFFDMDVQATRFNLYKDTSQWKPFHFDAAAIKADKAQVQNFTVAVSFGATRDAAFEDAKTRTVVSMPQPDGMIYAFAKDTNVLWRHGILKEKEVRPEGRISIIAWGKIPEVC